MTLEKQVLIDEVKVLIEYGQIEVRQATKIMEDGVELSKTFHRHVLAPGDNVENEDTEVKAITGIIWTEEKIKKYQDFLKKQQEKEIIQVPDLNIPETKG